VIRLPLTFHETILILMLRGSTYSFLRIRICLETQSSFLTAVLQEDVLDALCIDQVGEGGGSSVDVASIAGCAFDMTTSIIASIIASIYLRGCPMLQVCVSNQGNIVIPAT
jgi:hypothetical protein